MISIFFKIVIGIGFKGAGFRILMQSPSDAILFTTNIKHFEPICSEIKKKCLTPLST